MPVIERPNGIRLPYEVDGDGDGPRFVCAHGLTGQGKHMRDEMQPLVRDGWTLVTFDQRGHAAATPVTDPALYDPWAMGADLLAIMDELGWDRAWIGGGSMGAATSVCAALTAPERVLGLVQLVPAIWDKPHEQIPMFDVYAQVVREQGIDAAVELVKQYAASEGRIPEPGAIDRTDDLRAHDSASLACALAVVPRWILENVPGRLADVEFPVVVMGWEGDPIHPWPVAEAYAASTPRSTLVKGDMAETTRDLEYTGKLVLDALAKISA